MVDDHRRKMTLPKTLELAGGREFSARNQEHGMPHYLPSSSETDNSRPNAIVLSVVEPSDSMADLKIFWGPEIYRLEYLVHLLETGRIKDERRRNRVKPQAAEGASRRS
jgi:hypothetical protein